MIQVLLIGADQEELSLLAQALTYKELQSLTAPSVRESLALWKNAAPDLIVLLDHDRPRREDVEALREVSRAFLIVVCPTMREDELIEWMGEEVDLVIFRPYSTLQLANQIWALQRHVGGVPLHTLPVVEHEGVSLDPDARTVHIPGRDEVRLTRLEFQLMYTLMRHAEQPLPSDSLIDKLWGHGESGSTNQLRKLVHRLREKVEPTVRSPQYIVTVPGVGYKFEIPFPPPLP